ncbi:MAG: hypothetical protein K2X65_07445 [Burkholderiaceae bacterium]|nr:hypothetical protein [Burkholderiaceae bacterium]
MVDDAFTALALQPADQDDDTVGDTQILVMGFGALGAAALAHLAVRPEPGLTLLPAADTAQMAKEALTALPSQDASPALLLGGAHMLVLLVDEADAAQTELATAVARAAHGKLRLVTGVALSGPGGLDVLMQDVAARRLSEDLAASVQHFVRLDMGADGHTPPDTSAVLQSLTADMAYVCNRQCYNGFDFEDIMTVMTTPGPLTIGIGTASGPDRAQLATQRAMARAWPDCGDERPKYSVMLIISSASTNSHLAEERYVARAVRERLDPDQHCLHAAIYNDTLGDQLQVALLVIPTDLAG